MKERIYKAGSMPFSSWRKENKDLDSLVLQGDADEDTIISIEALLQQYTLRFVTLDNFFAKNTITDEGTTFPYLETWKQKAQHNTLPLMILVKLMLNQRQGCCYRVDSGIFTSEDSHLLAHYPFENHSTLPSSIQYIGDYTFCGYQWLRSIIFNDGLIGIGECAFLGCKKLHYIELPDSVTQLGFKSFADGNLYNVKLPAMLTDIPAYCFAGSHLGNVIIPPSVRNIGGYAFNDLQQKNVVIPEGVRQIERGALSHAKAKHIMLPASLQSLDREFCDAVAIKSKRPLPYIDVDENNSYYYSDNGIVKCRDTHLPSVKMR